MEGATPPTLVTRSSLVIQPPLTTIRCRRTRPYRDPLTVCAAGEPLALERLRPPPAAGAGEAATADGVGQAAGAGEA